MAQLGARLNGIEEVVGSNPTGSTKIGRKAKESAHIIFSGSSKLSAREMESSAENSTKVPAEYTQ